MPGAVEAGHHAEGAGQCRVSPLVLHRRLAGQRWHRPGANGPAFSTQVLREHAVLRTRGTSWHSKHACATCALRVKWQRPRSTTHKRAAHQPRCGALLVAYSSLPAKTPGAGAADWEAARFCKSLARPAFRFCASSRRNAVVASEAFWAAGSAAGCGAGCSDRSAASILCTCLDPRIAVCPRCAAPLPDRTTAAQGLKRHCECARCCALESLTTVHVFRKDLVRPVHGVKWQLARRITTLAG